MQGLLKLAILAAATIVAKPAQAAAAPIRPVTGAAAAADQPVAEDADGNPDLRDPTRLPRQIRPLWITPERATMGVDFTLRLAVPFTKLRGVFVRQNDGAGNFVAMQAGLAPAPNGDTLVTVTPLVIGNVACILNAALNDYSFAVQEFTLRVAPPAQRPRYFWPDIGRHEAGLTAPLMLHIGQIGLIDPVIVFAQTPDQTIHLRRNAVFRVVQDATAPVIEMHGDGTFTGLREGRATIEVGFAGFTAGQAVEVNQRAPLLIDR
jgi:hypothetical protein